MASACRLTMRGDATVATEPPNQAVLSTTRSSGAVGTVRRSLFIFVTMLSVFGAAGLARADCQNVRDYGAVADGKHDDTTAIQAAINAVVTPLKRGGSVCLPMGDYRITHTIVVDDVVGIRLVGDGGATRLLWDGDDRSPLLLLSSVQDAEIRAFQIVARVAKPLDVAIQCITRQGAAYKSKHNMFVALRVDGVTHGVRKGFQIGGAGPDENNDFHLFENVVVANYSNIGFSIEHTQVYGLLFVNCLFLGGDVSQIGVATDQNKGKGGNFAWQGGGGAGNKVADFSLGAPNSGAISIANAIFETSARFLRTAGPSGAPFLLDISSIRWSGDALAADGVAIDFRFPGPWSIRNSRFGSDATKPLTITWSPGGVAPVDPVSMFIFEGNRVTRAPDGPMFLGRQPDRAINNVIR